MSQTLAIHTAAQHGAGAALTVIYANEGAAPAGAGAAIWQATGLDWAAVSATAGFKGRQGQVLDLLAPNGVAASRLLVLGAGKAGEGTLNAWTDRGGSLLGKLVPMRAATVTVILDDAEATPAAVAELAAGL
ncbi:MAG: M17 family peptidase N-terminal domain-containing protein, partial [Devosia sp.]